jgi:hypothetical protein
MRYIPDQFLASTSLTAVNSVFTLPWDFGRVFEFKDNNGRKVFPATARILPAESGTGSKRVYYRKGNTFVLTKSGETSTYTLWYYTKPRDIAQGLSADSNTLAASAKLIADYYNGMIIENATDDWIDTISDYTAARIITIGTETLAASKYYGIVSEIPEIFHPLISPRAIQICKAEHPLAQEKPTANAVQLWADEVIDTLVAFAGNELDVSQEEIWSDYGTGGIYGGIQVPGQGYDIY